MASAPSGRARILVELIVGYVAIVGVIWTPDHLQRLLSPVVLLLTLSVVLAQRQSANELGIGGRELVPSLWILPAAIALCFLSRFAATRLGTLHPLYKGDFKHTAGYVIWTIYQQFLLQDYFMARLLRLLSNNQRAHYGNTNYERKKEFAASGIAGSLFALAHLPNVTLTAATLVWGVASCLLFRRHRNLWTLGLAQGLLGLCFAVCVPDALHHHLRVGLGYLRYGGAQPTP